MATEFKLSYTGAEINERLGKVDENTSIINELVNSKADKSDLPTIDSEISAESENPVQNKVVKEYVDSTLTLKVDKSEIPEDEEVLRMLAEADVIELATDENGDTFTDLNGNIIVF